MKKILCKLGLHRWINFWSYDNGKYHCKWCLKVLVITLLFIAPNAHAATDTYFSVARVSDYSTTACDTVIPYDTIISNSNNLFNTSTYRYTPTTAGIYHFDSITRFGGTGVTNGYTHVFLYKNGSLTLGSRVVWDNTSTRSRSVDMPFDIYLNGTTDYVELKSCGNGVTSAIIIGGLDATIWQGYLALSTSTTATVITDNPNLNLWLGIIIFFISMFFPIWFFKSRGSNI